VELWPGDSTTEMVVMVTHGIDEAILLSDKIVVMSNPPGPSIVDIIDVEIPRLRDRVSLADSPEYKAVQARLMVLLQRDEIRDSAAA